MKKLFTVFASLLLAVTVLSGCGGGDTAREDKSLIRVAIGGDTAVLDPAIVDDSITANILNQMYEGLYTLDKDGNVIPNLAEADPTISEDGLKYTIKLKEGLKWSDGKDLVANDFVYAWKRAAAIGGADAYYSQFIFNNIVGAESGASMESMSNFGAVAKDDKTIEITIKKKVPYFTALLTNTVFYPVREDYIKSKTDETKSVWADETDAPTNGAFRATKINTKDEIVLSKNKEYYDADKVKVKKISFKVMADSDAQTSAFTTGEIDFATTVNVETVLNDDALKEDVYLIDPYVINYFVLFNSGNENTTPELKDPEIRKAISQSIDRSEVLNAFGYGEYAYELSGLVPRGIPGVNGDFREEADKKGPYSEFDLKSAKKIMESKGYSKSKMLKLSYKYNDLPMHKDVAQALQASMKKAYIDLELIGTEKETFFEARDKGDFVLARHAMSADFIDPMAYLSMYYGVDTAGNTVDDLEYERLIDEANALEGDARLEGLHKAEKYLIKEKNYMAPLHGYSDPILKASDLKGVTSSPEGHYDLTQASYK